MPTGPEQREPSTSPAAGRSELSTEGAPAAARVCTYVIPSVQENQCGCYTGGTA